MIFEKQKLRDLEREIEGLRNQRDAMAHQITELQQTQGQRRVSPLSSDPAFDPLGLSIRLHQKMIDITDRRLGGIVKVNTADMVSDRMMGKAPQYKRDVINHVIDELKKNILKSPASFLKTKHDPLTETTYVACEVYFLTPEDVGQERDLLLEGRTMENNHNYDIRVPAPLDIRFNNKDYGVIGVDTGGE